MSQKYRKINVTSKHTDATSSKRISSQKKTEEHLKTCSCKKLPSSSSNSIQSVFVQDRVVQVPEISNGAYRFGEFNPVRTLRFLMKELEDSVVKDKRTNEIFNEIEQILCRIPASSSPKKSAFGELDIIFVQSKLEESKIKLQEYSKQMKAKCESWMSEREKLLSQIQKRDACLKEADQKQEILEDHIKELTFQLKEVRATVRAAEDKDETVSTLKQQIKDDEKVISELRTELAKQTKLARDRHIKNQYMIIEKEKLSVLSSYKDTLNIEFRNTIKEFQNDITEQLAALKEKYINGGNPGSPVSPVDTGVAYSSPNSSSIDGHGLSDISLSVVERTPQERVALKGNAANKDSTRFISLALGESSHTLVPESFQKQVANNGEMAVQHHNKIDAVPHRNASNTDHEFARKSLHRSSKENHNAKNMFNKPMVSDIEKQVQNILDDMQNRVPVDVPSPLRDCPPPDWSDSSLSSVDTATDVDIVPSNDI
ncbi:uncharacterized protein LOC116847138 isoform X2 [Odontomachus brunneus]|uniref:uncharacterized protein LOC116847138 isoform X2 n=1 Tax=Odontomachus brunneus TaxID=486640 RepID=UPI0013F199A8|nr:uncharacterized protein LOC116847138 isoform X2 [Odontomachus brunneus]